MIASYKQFMRRFFSTVQIAISKQLFETTALKSVYVMEESNENN
jgi:hypothetical protein